MCSVRAGATQLVSEHLTSSPKKLKYNLLINTDSSDMEMSKAMDVVVGPAALVNKLHNWLSCLLKKIGDNSDALQKKKNYFLPTRQLDLL